MLTPLRSRLLILPRYDLPLKSLDSPILEREGLKGDKQAAGIKAGDWVRARVKGNSDKAVAGGTKEKAVVGGLKVKYYD